MTAPGAPPEPKLDWAAVESIAQDRPAAPAAALPDPYAAGRSVEFDEILRARKQLSNRLFWLLVGWLGGLMLLLLGSGLRWLQLSDTVLVALTTGLTVNILGLIVIILRFFFSKF